MIINVPNTITFIRIFLAINFMIFFLNQEKTLAMIMIFTFAFLDKIDGLVARKLNQVTQFGANFDVAVDGLSIIAIYLMFYLTKTMTNQEFITILIAGIIYLSTFYLVFRKYKDFKVSLPEKIAGLSGFMVILLVYIPLAFQIAIYALSVYVLVLAMVRTKKYLI